MERLALAKLGCRLVALVLAVQGLADAIASTAVIRRLFVESVGRTDAAWSLLPVVLIFLMALVLALAPAPLVRRGAGLDASRRVRAADARQLVTVMGWSAGVIILVVGIDHVTGALWILSLGSASGQWHGMVAAAVVLGSGIGLLAGARRLAARCATPEPQTEPGPARLLGELAGAAGALGARRLAELAISIKTEAEGVAKRVMRSSIDAMIAAVEQRKPDFGAASSADGTVTIAFSDMEGFTAMTQRLGDAAAHEVIKNHNQIVRRALKKHGGQEVELQGDGFLLAFPDTAQALRCATAIQRACAEHSAQADAEPIRVRIGLHRGTPIQEGDRFFGITVILAARIAGQACGAQVLVSQDVHDAVVAIEEFRFEAPREAELKGLAGRHRMHPLIWA